MCELVFLHRETGKFARLATPAKFEIPWQADLFSSIQPPPPGLEWCKIYDEKILEGACEFDELIELAKNLHLGENWYVMLRNLKTGETKHPYAKIEYYGDKEIAKKFNELIQPEEGFEWVIIDNKK